MPNRDAQPHVLLSLFHHRWAVPIIAELDRDGGARFATLMRRLGAPKESLRYTLSYLAAQRLVMRNPGYGHPVRPEYILGELGGHVGAAIRELVDWLRARGIEAPCLQKWPLVVLRRIDGGHGRFSELRAGLQGMTPRALSLALRSVCDLGLCDREVVEGRPPSTRYSTTAMGRELSEMLGTIEATLHDAQVGGVTTILPGYGRSLIETE